jgi:hypothetical protein
MQGEAVAPGMAGAVWRQPGRPASLRATTRRLRWRLATKAATFGRLRAFTSVRVTRRKKNLVPVNKVVRIIRDRRLRGRPRARRTIPHPGFHAADRAFIVAFSGGAIRTSEGYAAAPEKTVLAGCRDQGWTARQATTEQARPEKRQAREGHLGGERPQHASNR